MYRPFSTTTPDQSPVGLHPLGTRREVKESVRQGSLRVSRGGVSGDTEQRGMGEGPSCPRGRGPGGSNVLETKNSEEGSLGLGLGYRPHPYYDWRGTHTGKDEGLPRITYGGGPHRLPSDDRSRLLVTEDPEGRRANPWERTRHTKRGHRCRQGPRGGLEEWRTKMRHRSWSLRTRTWTRCPGRR